ncbi:hypothetical protein TIFTF001_042682 [Ficus carica]|uniref:Uncharacterized protein n=1 Tax=Ficus carica TaxID=3494 RepID=A0AA87ZQB4_FICCA|nr:hypothetical protein TIFTF001_042682 [Ficus carica]
MPLTDQRSLRPLTGQKGHIRTKSSTDKLAHHSTLHITPNQNYLAHHPTNQKPSLFLSFSLSFTVIPTHLRLPERCPFSTQPVSFESSRRAESNVTRRTKSTFTSPRNPISDRAACYRRKSPQFRHRSSSLPEYWSEPPGSLDPGSKSHKIPDLNNHTWPEFQPRRLPAPRGNSIRPIRQQRGAPPPSFNSLWLGLQNLSTNFVIPLPGERRRERGGAGGGMGWGQAEGLSPASGVVGDGRNVAGDGENKSWKFYIRLMVVIANACHARLWPLDRPQLQPRWWVTLLSRHVKSYVSELRSCVGLDAHVSIVFCASIAELHC